MPSGSTGLANEAITAYWAGLESEQRSGEATEHSFRPALKRLLESLGAGILAVNDPKRVTCGAPDFVVGQQGATVGHVETKDLGAALAAAAESEQLLRYREALPNLILTNYLEFRWYVEGELRLEAELGRQERGRLRQVDATATLALLRGFLNAPSFRIGNPEELARRLAGAAQLARAAIRAALAQEGAGGGLHEQMAAFQQILIQDLTAEQFADMYAQTICYGLFSARCMHRGRTPFTRQSAPFDLPKTNPFLRWLFGQIAGPELDERVAWVVNAVAQMLDRTEVEAVLLGFGRGGGREDPVFHFYETFLQAYDPSLRARRGVFYTPQAVVGYVVRCADEALQEKFGMKEGLAEANALVLDPAAGTGAFLHDVIERVHARFAGNAGLWSAYVSEQLLPRLVGFELLMAPYAVAHFKLGLQLQQSGYDFAAGERLRVYLTNTLEEAHQRAALLPMFTRQLAEEADAASKVKRDSPVMVILGNPPYAGHSANTGAWLKGLLHGDDALSGQPTQSYFAVDGKPLGERNTKWLNDDYVKFMRFAQWRIEKTGYGVLAFITNNGYLENPTFRGMRQALAQTFDEIYVLNLHGDSKKRERTPEGGKDENVFDIQQGVAIGIFIRRRQHARKPEQKREAAVYFHELWGTRQTEKYPWLEAHGLKSTPWQRLKPKSPLHLFTPQAPAREREYERGWLLTEAMPVNVLGFQSH
ncbi:MAG: N-6 DNA methylase, partial [Terriglobales bacterium]